MAVINSPFTNVNITPVSVKIDIRLGPPLYQELYDFSQQTTHFLASQDARILHVFNISSSQNFIISKSMLERNKEERMQKY